MKKRSYKKIMATLMVLCMVLTTLVVPGMVFAEGEGSTETTKTVNVSIRGDGGTFSITLNGTKTEYVDPINIDVAFGESLKNLGYNEITLPTFDNGRTAVAWKICTYDSVIQDFVVVKEEWGNLTSEALLEISINYETAENEQLIVLPVTEAAPDESIDIDTEQYKDACEAFFNTILDKDENNNVLDQITVRSVDPSNVDDLYVIFDSLFEQIQAPDPLWFGWCPVSDEEFGKIELSLSVDVETGDTDPQGDPIVRPVPVMTKVVDVNYIHDDAIEEKIIDFVESIELANREFKLRDMELINYWYNISLAEEDSMEYALINFSSEFKKAIDTYNFYFTVREGNPPSYYSFEAGTGTLIYDDTFYGLTPRVAAKGEHIIYVNGDADDTAETLKAAAEDRIKRYLGDEVYAESGVKIILNKDVSDKVITVGDAYNEMYNSYNAYVNEMLAQMQEEKASWEQNLVTGNKSEEEKSFINERIDEIEQSIEATRQSLVHYEAEIAFLKDLDLNLPTFTIEINGFQQSIIIVPGGELADPSLTTKDFATDVEISTDATEIPLDSMIEAEQKDAVEDVLKEEKGVTDDNSLTYDLKVYSKTLAHAKSNAKYGYITELANGEFEVVVPIKDTSLEGKTLVAYYVYTDGPGNSGNEQIEEHAVTVENGYAKFTTNHFSTYTLAPVTDTTDPAPKEIEPTIKVAEGSYTYTGQQIKPKVTVTSAEGNLTASDYTVTYRNNVNAGTATISITPKEGGRYTWNGEATATFTIGKKQLIWDTSGLQATDSANTVDKQTKAATLYGTLALKGILAADAKDAVFDCTADKLTGTYMDVTAGKQDVTLAWADGNSIALTGDKAGNYRMPAALPTIKGTINAVHALSTPPEAEGDYRLEMETGISEVPDALKNTPGLNTPEKINEAMRLSVEKEQGVSSDTTQIYDVELQYYDPDQRKWIKATGDNFPKSGITVTLPYTKGTAADTHDYVVGHMIVVGSGAGTIEYPDVTETASGIQFKVYSLSPISVTPTPEAAVVAAADTGDDTSVALWMIVMAIAGAGILLAMRRAQQH